MELSNTPIDPCLPYWHDYLPFLRHLADQEFPNCDQLNSLLPEGLSSEDGHKICFVSKLGFSEVRQRGSHVVMRREESGCVVPLHKELKIGTLSGILKQAGVSVDDFIEVL